MFKKLFLILLSGFIISSLMSQDLTSTQTLYNLQQCMEIAYKNNPDVKQSELSAENARINYDQSKGNMFPTLNAGITHTLYNGRSINPYTNSYIDQSNTAASYQLYSSVTLWNGSSLQHYMQQNELSYEAGKMDAQNSRDKLTISLILDYLTVLSTQEQLNIAEKQVLASKKKVEILELKNNDGAISPSDLYDMKGQLASDELTVVTTKNNLESAKLALVQLMNMPYTKEMQLAPISDGIVPQPYDATVQEIYDNASKRLAAVKSADLKVASAEKSIQTVKGQLMPTIYLYGGLYSNYSSAATTEQYINSTDIATNSYVLLNNVKNTVYSTQQNYTSLPLSYGNQISNNLNSQIGIGLTVPILNSFLYKNKLRLAKVAEKQATVQAQTIKIQLRQAIEQDYVNLNATYHTYLTLMNQVSYFEQSLHAADVRFAAGAITIVDYVIAKNNYDRATINLIAAKYDYILRTKVLDFFQSRSIY